MNVFQPAEDASCALPTSKAGGSRKAAHKSRKAARKGGKSRKTTRKHHK